MARAPAVHRTILVVDVEGFGAPARTDSHRLAMRDGLHRVLERALTDAGLSLTDCYREDRGDGVLILAPPAVPKSVFADPAPRMLAEALHEHNGAHSAEERLRLRVALHAGEVFYDEHGVVGSAINLAFRLLDAPAFKRALAESPGVLGLITSSWFFEEVIRHAASGVVAAYRQVQVIVKETAAVGWITFPGELHQAAPREPADAAARLDAVDSPRRAGPILSESPSDAVAVAIGQPAQVGQAIQGRNIYVHGDHPAINWDPLVSQGFTWRSPQQLPADVVPFVGRESESRSLEALLREPDRTRVRVLLVTGAAGCGKSALAIHAARRVADAYADGQLWVRLERAGDGTIQPSDILYELLASLGVGVSAMPRSLEARAAAYQSLLARRRVLIVLDGAERTRQIQDLLPAGSSCAVIVTSRYDLPSLESSAHISLRGLARSESMSLLDQVAGSDARLRADSAHQLVDALGGHPLAIRLAGEVLRDNQDLRIEELAHRVAENEPGLKAQGPPLRFLLERAYRQMGQMEALTFRMLAFLPGLSFEAERCR